MTVNLIEEFRKSKDARSLAAWVKEQYDKSKSSRLPYERQWQLNYAFYKGRQNVAYLGETINGLGGGKLTVPKAPPHRVRHITNRIKPIIRTEIARLTSNKPTASVAPASSEDKDLFAAQAAEKLWEYLYSQKKVHATFSRAMFWLAICGTSFMKTWWDPNAVCSYSKDEQYQGDICYGAVTPFHLFIPDLMEEDLDAQSWVINAYTKPVEWANLYWNADFRADVTSATEVMGESFFKTQAGAQKPDSVLIIEMWLKPGAHKLLPQGGLITVANESIIQLEDQGIPYQHGEFPFTKFTHIPTGEFYADSVINDLISPQREYNRTRSQVIEAKNRMARPQIMAPAGSVDASKITTQPGQVIFYKPGLTPPQPLPLQPLPAYVLQELDRTIGDMEDISSQHAVSRGETPTGVTAATAISYLQEKDDSPLTATYQSIEQGMERIARHSLSYVNEFWDEPRIIAGTGIDDMFDALTLKGSDIDSGMDIRMEAGSALPNSKAARQAFLMDLMDKGYVDPNKALAMMNMGGLEKLYDEIKADERQAMRENLRMQNLDIQAIFQRQQEVANAEMQAQMALQMQPPMLPPDSQPGIPPEQQDAQLAMQDQEQMLAPPPAPDIGYGTDTQTGEGLAPSPALIAVNTYDNHQVHIDRHNLFRKSQAFELLADPIKQQFEEHVMLHAQALMQSAMNANMQMGQDQGAPPTIPGPENGTGTPLGTNQFGPPGAPAPPVGDMTNG